MSITSVRVGKHVKAVDSSVVRKLDKLSSSEMSRKGKHFDTKVDNHEFGGGGEENSLLENVYGDPKKNTPRALLSLLLQYIRTKDN